MVFELYCKKAAEEDFFVEYNVTENSFTMSLDAGLRVFSKKPLH